jgi:TonB family protein
MFRTANSSRTAWLKLMLGCVLIVGGSAALSPQVLAQDSTPDAAARKVRTKVVPEYPSIAKQLNLHGKVRIAARVSPDGHVTSTDVIGGHPTLASAAEDAIKRWRFEPAPKETTEIIEFVFAGKT